MKQLTLTEEVPEISIFTIGYGGRKFREIRAELEKRRIGLLIDIRSNPYTERYGKELFQQMFGKRYLSIPQLGGKEFPMGMFQAWKEAAKEALLRIIELSKTMRIAVMCAEKNPLKCHRSYFVARALREMGFEVQHIR